MGLFFYMLAYWGLTGIWHAVQPAEAKLRRNLKAALHNIRTRLRWDWDILPDERVKSLQDLLDSYKEINIRQLKGPELIQACERIQRACAALR